MSSQDTKDILVLTIMCLKFENALNKQVFQIAMEFQEFLQLEQSLKVCPFFTYGIDIRLLSLSPSEKNAKFDYKQYYLYRYV